MPEVPVAVGPPQSIAATLGMDFRSPANGGAAAAAAPAPAAAISTDEPEGYWNGLPDTPYDYEQARSAADRNYNDDFGQGGGIDDGTADDEFDDDALDDGGSGRGANSGIPGNDGRQPAAVDPARQPAAGAGGAPAPPDARITEMERRLADYEREIAAAREFQPLADQLRQQGIQSYGALQAALAEQQAAAQAQQQVSAEMQAFQDQMDAEGIDDGPVRTQLETAHRAALNAAAQAQVQAARAQAEIQTNQQILARQMQDTVLASVKATDIPYLTPEAEAFLRQLDAPTIQYLAPVLKGLVQKGVELQEAQRTQRVAERQARRSGVSGSGQAATAPRPMSSGRNDRPNAGSAAGGGSDAASAGLAAGHRGGRPGTAVQGTDPRTISWASVFQFGRRGR